MLQRQSVHEENREFQMTAAHFREIAGTMERLTGIALSDTKEALVYSRLAKRMRILGLKSFGDYCRLVNSPEGEDELALMTESLTTNVTKFFREMHHFDHFQQHMLEKLVIRAKSGGRVRIWSAGCSSGQEPYSIALLLLSKLPNARAFDISILATDISEKVLAQGRAGSYSLEELASIPPQLAAPWIDKGRTEFEFDAAVKRLIKFLPLNLIDSWPMQGPFDAIFCRNVMIYFPERIQNQLCDGFASILANDGVLYIGHSERVSGPATAKLKLAGTTTYVKSRQAVA